jgi:hypothetical protein
MNQNSTCPVCGSLLMNPNYRNENAALLQSSHIDVDLIDMIEYGGVVE